MQRIRLFLLFTHLGNVYIVEEYNHCVRKVTISTGIITTVAGTGSQGFSGDGGPATSATLYRPMGVAVDSSVNMYIVDRMNCRIRKVTASTNVMTTFAGNGDCNFYGDGGQATSAAVAYAQGVTVDSSGKLSICVTTMVS